MDVGKSDSNHMGWLWVTPHYFSQLHYVLEFILLKIINNKKYLHRVHMTAGKKKNALLWNSFFKTTNHPQKPHGHKTEQFWSLICGAFKHSPGERLNLRLSFGDKQNIHENTWFGSTKKTVQPHLCWPESRGIIFFKKSLTVLKNCLLF